VGSEEVPDPKVVVKKEREAMTKKEKKKLPKVKVSELVKREGVTTVEVMEIERAPMPALNKPIQLNPQGKVDGKDEEKTFLQKYVESNVSEQTLTKADIGGLSPRFSSSIFSLEVEEAKRAESESGGFGKCNLSLANASYVIYHPSHELFVPSPLRSADVGSV
jgi:hypothetical protein